MELRHWIAAGIIAAVVVAGTVSGIVVAKRRRLRRLRLRGIKTHEHKSTLRPNPSRSAG